MTTTAAPSRVSLLGLLALDALLALALARLPSRLEQPAPPAGVSRERAGWSAVTDDRALFVVQTPTGPAVLTAPLARDPARPPTLLPLSPPDHGPALAPPQLALPREPGLATAAAPRWAWNGRALALLARASPAATPSAPHAYLVVLDPARDRVSPPLLLEGTRPSVGWARDHFEVAYLAPASPGGPNVQWLARFSAEGVPLAPPESLAPPGVAHPTLYWPGGERAPLSAEPANAAVLADGTAVTIPARDGAATHTYFRLRPDGRVEPAAARVTITGGSVSLGNYTARADLGDVTLVAQLGARNARPRFQVTRGAHRVVFETENEARLDELIAAEHAGALHLLDAHGFHVALAGDDLRPLGPRENRFTWLAGALGDGVLGLAFTALLLAHLLALLVERAARNPSEALNRYARFASSSLLVLAAGALLVVWSASTGLALP